MSVKDERPSAFARVQRCAAQLISATGVYLACAYALCPTGLEPRGHPLALANPIPAWANNTRLNSCAMERRKASKQRHHENNHIVSERLMCAVYRLWLEEFTHGRGSSP